MRRRLTLGVLVTALAVVGWFGIRDLLRGYWTTRGASVVRFTIHSSMVGRDLHEILVIPPHSRSRELLVFLHGRGSGPGSNLRQPLFDGLHDLHGKAPAVLLADGGDHSYWHDRRDGAWAGSLIREVLPAALERSGARSSRVAIGGISMGGFGALDLARLFPGRFCAVGAHSPALWFSGGGTPAGAFDDAADFGRNDLLGLARKRKLYDVPVWIDVGRADPFYEADVAFAHQLHAHGVDVQLEVEPGGHGGWSHRLARYLRYYATACG